MNKPVRIAPEQSDFRARFTAAEFLRMADAGAFDDMWVELVRGELERTTPPMSEHGRRQAQVAIRLSKLIPEDRLVGDTAVLISNDTVLGCDAAILTAPVNEHRALRPEDVLLVVEVAETTSSRDLGLKRELYAEAGIPNYWVIDSKRSIVHVYGRPKDGDYAEGGTVGFGVPLTVPGTEGTVTID